MASDLGTAANARIGATLRGKWRLDRVIGVGGMATVYLATHRNGSRVAIKMLHAEISSDGETLRRFLREGYLANKVEHPGAVHVIDDDVAEDGSAFLVMELLDGQSLDALVRFGPMPIGEALRVTRLALDVLAAAHERGVVHRDIKPENIFVTRDGSVKVLDFGIAGIRENAALGGGTLSGMVLGTPAFMPPEQARGRWELVDGQSDVWALGATLFTLLSGKRLREAETINEELLLAMSQPFPSAISVVPTLPADVAEIVDRALAFDKALRWPSARAMLEAVRAAEMGLQGRAADTLLAPSSGRPAAPRPVVLTPQHSAPLPMPVAQTIASGPPPFMRPGRTSTMRVLGIVAAVIAFGAACVVVMWPAPQKGARVIAMPANVEPVASAAPSTSTSTPTSTPTSTATATPTSTSTSASASAGVPHAPPRPRPASPNPLDVGRY